MIETTKKKETTKKINVNFETTMQENMKKKNSNYNIEFKTDINSNIKIQVKHLKNIIYKKDE